MQLTHTFWTLSTCLLYLVHLNAAKPVTTDQALSKKLFPPQFTYSKGFSTASGVSVSGVSSASLSDSALGVQDASSSTTHNIVTVGNKTTWEAIYPKGSWNPSNNPKGGFSLYVSGPKDFSAAVLNGAREAMFSYSVQFPSGFKFNKGGKVPGAFGGNGNSAYGCSGGRQDSRSKCFDARLMWRTNAAGELYTYLPLTSANNASQFAVPGTVADSDYGYSVGRGSFTFPTGKWLTVAQRVRLNTISSNGTIGQDGAIQVWVDGVPTIDLEKVQLRSDNQSTIMGMHFQTFFGGSTSDWASPQNQKAYFADVSGAIITGKSS